MPDSEHLFGGAWTEVKLEVLVEYLTMYTRALKPQGFDLWYIDAFAGSGERIEVRPSDGPLLGPSEIRTEVYDGSAKRALSVQPPFDHFVFIEKMLARCEALERLVAAHPSRDIRVVRGDANAVLKDMVVQPPWSLQGSSHARGVVFLDPYAMHMDWATLTALAGTRAFDVWYLFPLQAVVRNLARDAARIISEERLDRALGPEWRELYEMTKPQGFFPLEPELRREATKREVEGWFRRRLGDVFAYVSKPLPILTTRGQDFSLFLTVANPSRKAVDLARKFAEHVRTKHGPKVVRGPGR